MTNTSRLRVRFNDDGLTTTMDYHPAKMVRINYANKDYFSIACDANEKFTSTKNLCMSGYDHGYASVRNHH
jgi:hypothetical protein